MYIDIYFIICKQHLLHRVGELYVEARDDKNPNQCFEKIVICSIEKITAHHRERKTCNQCVTVVHCMQPISSR